MFGIFKKFKAGLAKTVAAISEKTRGLFGGRKIDTSSLAALGGGAVRRRFRRADD